MQMLHMEFPGVM